VPDRSTRAVSETGRDLNALVEFAGSVPPAIVGVHAETLAEGLRVGHFTDLPSRGGQAVGVDAGKGAAHVVPGALRFQPPVYQLQGCFRRQRPGDEHRSGLSPLA
jgi:hypothetical protein